jgi:hypothetical protein
MLMEKAVSNLAMVGAPMSTGATFVAGEPEIHVPVFGEPSGKVFAPPFLVPEGEWTVVFNVVNQLGQNLVFDSVNFRDLLDPGSGVPPRAIVDNVNEPGLNTWRTLVKGDAPPLLPNPAAPTVPTVSMIGCTINLKPISISGPGEAAVGLTGYSGDPTIAVVGEPIIL